MSNKNWLLLGDDDSKEVLEALQKLFKEKKCLSQESDVKTCTNGLEELSLENYSKILIYLNSEETTDFSKPTVFYKNLLNVIFKARELPPFIFFSTETRLIYKEKKDFKGYEWCYLLYEAVGYQYIHLPGQLGELQNLLKEKAGEKEENPLKIFGDFENSIDSLKPKFKKYEEDKEDKEGKEGKVRLRYEDVIAFYLDVCRFHLNEEKYRRDLVHIVAKIEDKEIQVLETAAQTELFAWFDLIWALSQRRRLQPLKGEINVLVVDNNLRKEAEESLDTIQKYFKGWKFWQVGQDKSGEYFGKLLEEIEQGKKIRVKFLPGNKDNEAVREEEKEIEEFNLILQDLHLSSETKGDDFLPVYLRAYPHIPAFIYSRIDDSDVINRTLRKGVDYYLLKTRTIALPKIFLDYYDELGRLITLIDEKEYRNNLIGNIRRWRHSREYLWFGDKCYHMIDHSFTHSQNDWKIANQLLYPILKEKRSGSKNLIEYLQEDGKKAENLYSLCMAIWLHDIGHKGNIRYGEAHLVRDNHGIISGELILSQPHLFGIKSEDKDVYKDMVFPFGPQKKPVTQVVQERVKEKGVLSVLEKIALLSIYHKSGSPISKEDYKDLVNKEKEIPIDFFQNSNKEKDEITLQDIVGGIDDNFIRMVALFRFIDGIDVQRDRVGDKEASELKKRIIQQDKEYQKKMLQKEVEFIIKGKEENQAVRLAFLKTFYLDVIEKIDRGDFVSHLELRNVAQEIAEDLESYFGRVGYASFISVQPGHFDLHSSIEEVKIEHLQPSVDSKEIAIHYFSTWSESELKKPKIKKLTDKEKRSIKDHLLGTEDKGYKDGYVAEEWEKAKEWLGDVINLKRIILHTWTRKKENGKSEEKEFDVRIEIRNEGVNGETAWKEDRGETVRG